jgi:hypothetical protein
MTHDGQQAVEGIGAILMYGIVVLACLKNSVRKP